MRRAQIISTFLLIFSVFSHPILCQEPLELFVWNWRTKCPCTPDLIRCLDPAVDIAQTALGEEIDVSQLDDREYWDELMVRLFEDDLPDVLWVRHRDLNALTQTEILVPLDDFAPWLLDGIPESTLVAFRDEGHAMAVPIMDQGEGAEAGYAVTTAALEAGRLESAIDLIEILRQEVPVRGDADLIVMDLQIESESFLVGEPAILTGNVMNIGQEAAADVNFSVEVNGEEILSDWIPRVDSGRDEPFEMIYVPQEEGSFDFTVTVNPHGIIDENDDLNNRAEYPASFESSLTPTIAAPNLVGTPIDLSTDAYNYWPGFSSDTIEPFIAVGSNGSHFLVVWAQQFPSWTKGAPYKLLGAIIAGDGSIVGTKGFAITQSGGYYTQFSVTHDGTNFWVVWKDLGAYHPPITAPLPNPYNKIMGARVSNAGQLVDASPIVIEATPNTIFPGKTNSFGPPSVTRTGSQLLVAYNTRAMAMWGAEIVETHSRFLDASGTVSSPTTLVQQHTFQSLQPGHRSLASHAGPDAYLVGVYKDETTSPHPIGLAGFKIASGPSASPISTIFTASSSDWYSVGPVSITSGPTNQYFAIAQIKLSLLPFRPPTVHGALVDVQSSITDLGSLVGGWGWMPEVVFDGKNYTVIHSSIGIGGKGYLTAFRVTPQGKIGKKAVFKNAYDQIVDISAATGNAGILVAFTQFKCVNPPCSAGYDRFSVHATTLNRSQ